MTTALKIAVYNMRMLTDGDLKAADAICAGIDALTRERDEARARAVAAGEDADKRFPADEYYTNLNDALAQRDAALARAEKAERERDEARDTARAECARLREALVTIYRRWREREAPTALELVDIARAALAPPPRSPPRSRRGDEPRS